MREFPSWNSLKHFNHVSTISFTDGQSFYDILKVGFRLYYQGTLELFCIQCILPCIVQLLPRNSSLIHCIRACQCYRIVIGLRCMTDRRFKHLKELIKKYETYCSVCGLGISLTMTKPPSTSESVKGTRKKFQFFQTTLCISHY